MIPKFLRPEFVPFVSIERIVAALPTHTVEALRARLTDTQPPVVCAWCPEFDPTTQAPGLSHGLCPTCAAQLLAAEDLADQDARDQRIFDAMKRTDDVDDRDDRDEDCGTRCGASCGFCGRCS